MNLPDKIEITSESTDVLQRAFDDYMQWYDRYSEMSQGRTDFQIEKFIALDDCTPCHSYVHTLYQTRVMRGELLREVREGIELARTFEHKWRDKPTDEPIWWKTTGPNGGSEKLCWYDIDKMEYDHRVLELGMSIKDKLQQLQLFNAIIDRMVENNGGEFTREQYQREAPEYWSTRFQKQIADGILEKRTGISSGDLKSLRLAMADVIVPGSPNQVEHFPEVLKKTLSGDPGDFVALMNEMAGNIDQELRGISHGSVARAAARVSGGGTAKALRDMGVQVSRVEE